MLTQPIPPNLPDAPTILAIETSSDLASAALLHQQHISQLSSVGVQNHSQHILPMVQQLLRDAKLEMAAVDAIAFGAGPGSFTGVRTACGIAQGLAFAAQIPVLPLITLHAMAEQARQQQAGTVDFLCVLDARMNQVYSAQYRWLDEQWHIVQTPRLSEPSQVIAQDAPMLIGQVPYPMPQLAHLTCETGILAPSAAALLPLGLLDFQQGKAVDAAMAQPLYLRNNVALTTAERSAAKQVAASTKQTA